jgi:hypothetical protein
MSLMLERMYTREGCFESKSSSSSGSEGNAYVPERLVLAQHGGHQPLLLL